WAGMNFAYYPIGGGRRYRSGVAFTTSTTRPMGKDTLDPRMATITCWAVGLTTVSQDMVETRFCANATPRTFASQSCNECRPIWTRPMSFSWREHGRRGCIHARPLD